jgi:hypothetical protein
MGEVLKVNKKSIWVRVVIGCKDAIIIKRHRVKHHVLTYTRPDNGVNMYDNKGVEIDEFIHSTIGD